MRLFEHEVEVPVPADAAGRCFADRPERWLPPVVGVHGAHEFETVSPLHAFESARFSVGDSWRSGDLVARRVRVEFGGQQLGVPVVVIDGEICVLPSPHAGALVRFDGEVTAPGRGLRHAGGLLLTGTALRAVIDRVAAGLQAAAGELVSTEVSPCSMS